MYLDYLENALKGFQNTFIVMVNPDFNYNFLIYITSNFL